MKSISIISLLCLAAHSPQAFPATCEGSSNNSFYYVNGIGTPENSARESTRRIAATTKHPTFTLNYNHTEGVLSDLIEAARQKFGSFNSESVREILSPTTPAAWRDDIIQSWHSKFNAAFVRSADLKEHVARYTADLRSGKKVSVIAHSQGNFYANESRLLMTATLGPEQLQGFGIFGLAVPANNVAGNSNSSATYLTNNLDIITSVPGSMPANTVLLNRDGTKANISGLAAHGLIETYLSTAFTLVNQAVSGFNAMTAALPSPTPLCGTEAMDLVSYFSGTYAARTARSPSVAISITDTGSVSFSGASLLAGPSFLGPQGVTTTLSQGLQTLALDTSTGDRFTQSFKAGAFDQAYLYSTSTFYNPLGPSSLTNTTGPASWMFDRYSWVRAFLSCSDASVRLVSLSADKLHLSGLPAIELAQFTSQTVSASPAPDAIGVTVTVGMVRPSGESIDVAFAAANGIRRAAISSKYKSIICVPLR